MNLHSPNRQGLFLLLAALLTIVGCSRLPFTESIQTTTVTIPALTTAATQTVRVTLTPELTSSPSNTILHIWLPPEFDPTADNPAAEIFLARLQEFQNRRPTITIETRVKAINGSGGMLDTLAAARTAAPSALPDLVILPGELVKIATQEGILYPFEDLGTLNDVDWYSYTSQAGNLTESVYSLPFAGDALVLMYRPVEIENPPLTWEEVRQTPYPLLYSAANPLALFTLAQYQAAGGSVQDEDGKPYLDATTLAGVNIFYQQASSGGQMPAWLTQYEMDDQVWRDYQAERSPMASLWLSYYLVSQPDDTKISQLPTQSGEPYTLATSWVWALSNPDPLRRQISSELAVFFSDADFLGDWTLAGGYLPTQQDVLTKWPSVPLQALAKRVISSAHPIPPPDILSVLGPALQTSTIDVLQQVDTPSGAAEKAANQVNNP